MRRLPPLQPLVAFEAVARHASFRRAGDELGLTQSAISHQIRRLEAELGYRVLDRGPQINPTPAGAAVLPDLVHALDSLARLPARGRGTAGVALTLGAGASFATWWLASRLDQLAAAHPEVAIELVTVSTRAEADALHADVMLDWVPAAEARATSTQRPLPAETVFPVTSPGALAAGGPLALVWKGTPAAAIDASEWDWAQWLGAEATGRPLVRHRELGSALGAAVAGSGAVLARSLLAADALADGRLVALPRFTPKPSSRRQIVRWRQERIGDPAVQAIAGWLVSAAEATLVRLRG